MEGVKKILRRISLGEASVEDREALSRIPDEVFYSELESLELENLGSSPSTIDILINETREEVRELDSSYSEVIPQSSNNTKIRSFARSRILTKRFLKKQRVK